MPSPSIIWAPLALLALGVRASPGGGHRPHSSYVKDLSFYKPGCTSNVTVVDTTTVISSITIPVTHYVDVTVPHYVNITISSTGTDTVWKVVTESSTTTLHYDVSVTETDSATVTNTQSTTETESATVTNTETTTATVSATITTYTTHVETVLSTKVDPCPSTCSISAGTVNLFFWPTSRPYTYPSTWVNTNLGYTFTSPSVYMLIPTAKGTNSAGPAGPSTSSWLLELDLDEVSTIIDGTATRQLTISDLGTDCAQTAEPSAIATMVDPRCDPILAAPKQVSSWAYPCNACGRFGLFDPPYAVPTLTGGLVESSTTPTPVQTTTVVAPTATPPVGTLLIVYYSDGTPMATATVPNTGVSGTVTSSVAASPTITPSTTPSVTPSTLPSTSSSTSPTTVVTASATRVTGGRAWLISSIAIAVFLI